MKVLFYYLGLIAFVYVRMPSGAKQILTSRNLNSLVTSQAGVVAQFTNELINQAAAASFTNQEGSSDPASLDNIKDFLQKLERIALKSAYRRLFPIFEGVIY
jgi:hypothetical protein